MLFVDIGTHPSAFSEGGCKCCQPPSARIFTDVPPIGYTLAILRTSALLMTARPFPESELHHSDIASPPPSDDLPRIAISR